MYRVTLTCIIYKNADCINRTELTGQLKEARNSVSFREHDRALMRVSVSMFNNRRDVQRLLDFLKPLA